MMRGMNRFGYTAPGGPSPLDAAVAAEVRAELGRQKITPTAIASQLGVERTTLASRVSGAVAFRPAELDGLARQLGLRASTFVARAEAAMAEALGVSA